MILFKHHGRLFKQTLFWVNFVLVKIANKRPWALIWQGTYSNEYGILLPWCLFCQYHWFPYICSLELFTSCHHISSIFATLTGWPFDFVVTLIFWIHLLIAIYNTNILIHMFVFILMSFWKHWYILIYSDMWKLGWLLLDDE